MDMFSQLWNGEVGNVIRGSDYDEVNEVAIHKGVVWDIGEEIDDIDSFLDGKDLSKLTLYLDEGYRGEACYSGWYEENGKTYWLDIINDYMVYEATENK